MPLYSPPSGNNVNFELKLYTPPSGDSVNFTLEGAQLETKSSKFYFDWILYKRFASSFWFYWNLLKAVKKSLLFKWKLLVAQRLHHLISYPLHLTTPTISEFTFTTSVAGLLDSVTIDVYNTGDSGQTKIEIYLNNTIKKSLTINANNKSYHTYLLLDNSLVYTNDKIKIKITEVANNASDLKISIKQKTFSPFLEILKVFNVYRGVYFESPYLFGIADKWVIVLNQPINQIDNVLLLDSDTNTINNLNYKQIEGEYRDNRLEVTPDINITGDTLIVQAQDINNIFRAVSKRLEYRYNICDYPTYINGAFSFTIYLSVKKYCYSWDNNTWYGLYDVNHNTIRIEHLPPKEGENTLYIKYYFDDYGTKILTDEVTITYYASEVNASIDFSTMTLNYNDKIPLDRVEVYVDDELVTTYKPTCLIEGFSSYSYDSSTYELTIDEGTVNYRGAEYSFDSTTFKVRDSLDYDTGLVVLAIGFNTESLTLELRELEENDTLIKSYEDIGSDTFIPIWRFLFGVEGDFDDDFNFITTELSLKEANRIYYVLKLPVYTAYESLKYKIYDIIGRSKEIEMPLKYPADSKSYFYRLRVYDSDGNEIKQGQIHFESTLTYKIESL